jgi:hypothetical protein
VSFSPVIDSVGSDDVNDDVNDGDINDDDDKIGGNDIKLMSI